MLRLERSRKCIGISEATIAIFVDGPARKQGHKFCKILSISSLSSSVIRYNIINANIKMWYPQKPHILMFPLIHSSFFYDHCVKLFG